VPDDSDVTCHPTDELTILTDLAWFSAMDEDHARGGVTDDPLGTLRVTAA
jgi:hypothetical protein